MSGDPNTEHLFCSGVPGNFDYWPVDVHHNDHTIVGCTHGLLFHYDEELDSRRFNLQNYLL